LFGQIYQKRRTAVGIVPGRNRDDADEIYDPALYHEPDDDLDGLDDYDDDDADFDEDDDYDPYE